MSGCVIDTNILIYHLAGILLILKHLGALDIMCYVMIIVLPTGEAIV